jgi:site-specific DNA-methyltransferase (adenine-specific)
MIGHVTYEWQKLRPDWEFKPCVQAFTFGQHNHKDFGNNHRLLYRYQKIGASRYMDAVRVPSWRQLNGDKRADPRGRVPGDVFDFPRVTGNSKQRRKFCPTQLNEGLYERCIRSCCAKGDTVVDLFAGTGTLGRVAPRCGVDALMVELSRETVDNILADQPETEEVHY